MNKYLRYSLNAALIIGLKIIFLLKVTLQTLKKPKVKGKQTWVTRT